jgi:peptide/nickel transport system permease protein
MTATNVSAAIDQQPGIVRLRGQARGLRPGIVLAWLVVVFLAISVIWPGLIARESPLAVNPANTLQGPSLSHLFGTDQSGRDMFSRVVFGARESLSIGIAATAVGLAIAIVLGFAAGLAGRWADTVISRFLEVLFAFPSLLLALLFVAMFGAGVGSLIVAVGIGSAPGYARMIRGQVIAVRNAPYVEAARVLGHPTLRIMARSIFPNAMRPLLVLATLGIGQSIVWASALSFLGLGAAPPAPEWGALLAAGRDFISAAWWLEFFPGALIVATALAATAIGRHLQRRVEGRLDS